jgi:hypothetical protein
MNLVPAAEPSVSSRKTAEEVVMSRTLNKSLLYELEDHAAVQPSVPETVIYKDDGLLSVAGPIIVLCYVLMFGIAGFTFFGSGQALFVVAISITFAVIYFAIPYIFLKIRAGRDPRWRRSTEKHRDPMVEVGTGSIHRWEAIVQIVSVPVAIVIGFFLFALRWSLL